VNYLKSILWRVVTVFGRQVRDERTGEMLGKALVFSLGGRPWLIGLHYPYVRAVFIPENRVKYGRHRIGFATHPPVDYPRILPPPVPKPKSIASPEAHSSAPRPPTAFPRLPLWAILVHQPAEECRMILARWKSAGFDPSCLLLVHGGIKADFDQLDHPNAVFVPDANLRTVRHPVEKQSYSGPMREITRWMFDHPFSHICLVEHDHLPLISDWGDRLIELLDREQADVIFHHLIRVDGTNAPHYLNHLSDPRFESAWKSISKREDEHVVLNSIGTGSFWTREAFETVATVRSPSSPPRFPPPTFSPIYLEMELPTTAHHLGFRVRDFGDQNQFVTITPQTPPDANRARTQGAWSIHPVKGQ
jgi:hypothetical protein